MQDLPRFVSCDQDESISQCKFDHKFELSKIVKIETVNFLPHRNLIVINVYHVIHSLCVYIHRKNENFVGEV